MNEVSRPTAATARLDLIEPALATPYRKRPIDIDGASLPAVRVAHPDAFAQALEHKPQRTLLIRLLNSDGRHSGRSQSDPMQGIDYVQ
jgi:hypothetical protein